MGIGSKHSFNFLEPLLSRPSLRLLEVGCGKGELASILSQHVQVRAIDLSKEAIAATSQLGVNALEADFLNYDDEPFDIVFFSRSFHHIHPLTKTVEKADALMKKEGLFVIEDFAAEVADRTSVAWYFKAREELSALGLLQSTVGAHDFDPLADPLEWWNKHHFGKHHVAKASEMKNEIQTRFRITQEECVPYLYRYLSTDSLPGMDTTEIEEAIFNEEAQLIEAGKLKPIGYRVVAGKK